MKKSKEPPIDCITMRLYGDSDGKKFISPVWYSCGRCKPCPRDPEAKEDNGEIKKASLSKR